MIGGVAGPQARFLVKVGTAASWGNSPAEANGHRLATVGGKLLKRSAPR